MVKKAEDFTGKRFGRLTVISSNKVPGYGTSWLCQCDCGNQVRVRGFNLKAGNTRSCGKHKRNTPYERSRPRRGETKISWEAMLDRCFNKNSTKFHAYGERGITVCDRWLTYKNFLVDMGERPLGTTLDRKDNNGNYEPGNCRWATPKQQANNRRDNIILEAFGRKQTLRQWAEEYGLPVSTFSGRLKNHSVEEALKLPLYGALSSPEMKAKFYRNRKSNRMIEAFGQRKTLVEWSEEYGIRSAVLGARISRRGMTSEQALTTPLMARGVRHKGIKPSRV